MAAWRNGNRQRRVSPGSRHGLAPDATQKGNERKGRGICCPRSWRGRRGFAGEDRPWPEPGAYRHARMAARGSGGAGQLCGMGGGGRWPAQVGRRAPRVDPRGPRRGPAALGPVCGPEDGGGARSKKTRRPACAPCHAGRYCARPAPGTSGPGPGIRRPPPGGGRGRLKK